MGSQEPKYDLALGLDDAGDDLVPGYPEPGRGDGPAPDAEPGPDGMPSAQAPFVPEKAVPSLPPRERIESLLQKMRPCRGTLLGIVRACVGPVPVSQVNDLVAEMQKNNRSVFSAADLCSLLQRAGALELVNADGTPYVQDQRPREVVGEDGAPAVEACEPPVAHWVSTPDALQLAGEDNPLERLYALFDQDSVYLPIYKTILGLCAREGGAKTLALGAAVDNDPLVRSPRFFATYFVDRLEKCDALEWRGAWHTTEVGLQGMDALLDVESTDVPEGIDLVVESPYAAYDDFGPLEG